MLMLGLQQPPAVAASQQPQPTQQAQVPQTTTTIPQQQQQQAQNNNNLPLSLAMLGFNNGSSQQQYQSNPQFSGPIDPYAAMAVYDPSGNPGSASLDSLSFINASNLPTYGQ